MKRGFTLIEMVVVLTILAALTHLALRELGQVHAQRLVAAADRQLEDVRASVYDEQPDGTPVGFLADMGRLVSPTNGTLAELWARPAGVRDYAVLPARAENLCVRAADKAQLADEDIHVPTGWRGPYLRLPLGRSRLLDPWGNPIEARDLADLPRLWESNGAVVAIGHYGPRASAGDLRRLELAPAGGATARLVLRAVSTGGTTAGEITWRWYGPASGLITGAVATVTYPQAAVFEGLTPGLRIVCDSVTHTPRQINVRPGDNLIEIKVP